MLTKMDNEGNYMRKNTFKYNIPLRLKSKSNLTVRLESLTQSKKKPRASVSTAGSNKGDGESLRL